MKSLVPGLVVIATVYACAATPEISEQSTELISATSVELDYPLMPHRHDLVPFLPGYEFDRTAVH